MNRQLLLTFASLGLLLGVQAGAFGQAATTISFLPATSGDWGLSTNWNDPNMVGAHVPQSPFNEVVNMNSGGTAIVSGVFTDATDPAGPAGINLNTGILQIENTGQMKVFPSGFGSPGADGHVTVGGRLNIQGAGKLTATTVNFAPASVFDVDFTAATAAPLTVEASAVLAGTAALDYSGFANPLGKKTLIASTGNSILGSFSTVQPTGLGVAQRVLLYKENFDKQLVANVVNVPTVSINRQSGVATITNTHATSISLDGIVFRSPLGAFTATDFAGLGAGWTTPPTNSPTAVGQAYQGASVGSPTASLAPGASIQIGNMGFFKTPAPIAFLQETEDVTVEFTSPNLGPLPAPLVVNYAGNKVINNNIVLTVNPTSGQANVLNFTNFPQEIDAYRIRSSANQLQTGTWTSFDTQNLDDGTWRTSTQTGPGQLIEVQEGGTTSFVSTTPFALGKIFNTGFTQSGITFEFLLAGQDTFTTGAVAFGTLPTGISFANPGDFNDDGIVDAADYTVWRDNLGATETGGPSDVLNGNGNGGVVDATDYASWKQAFGTTYPGSGGGSIVATNVPEPSCFALFGIAIGASLALHRKGR